MVITSKIPFLLCLAIICHVVASAAVIKSIDLNSWAKHASSSYNAFPASSTVWGAKPPKHNERKYSLPLHLTEPAFIQVYNYGPGGSKVDIYDYHQKIGEAGSYNLTTSNNSNIGRVFLPKGNHSLSLQPYYKDDSLSTHFVKVHILPKSSPHSLKKRGPVYSNSDKYTPEYNAYVQWDYDNDSKHYHNGGDDSESKHHHHHDNDNDEDEDCDDDEEEEEDAADDDGNWDKSYHKNGHWWKWYSKEGWKMGRKDNKKVIYVSTINYSEPTAPTPVIVTSTLTVDYTSTIPEPPTPSPRVITITETETVNKAELTETNIITVNGATPAIGEAAVILPILIHTVTEYRDSRDLPSNIPNVEFNRIVTITAAGDITTISASPVTISNVPVTVTMNGQITTVFPDPVTVINEPITVTNEPKTIISTINANVTHFLFRQTVMQTVYQTDTALVTRTFTDHNSVLQTIIGGTSTKTENVVVTVYNTRPRTTSTLSTTLTPTPTPTPNLTLP